MAAGSSDACPSGAFLNHATSPACSYEDGPRRLVATETGTSWAAGHGHARAVALRCAQLRLHDARRVAVVLRLGERCCRAGAEPMPPAQTTWSCCCSAAVPIPLHGCNKQQCSLQSAPAPAPVLPGFAYAGLGDSSIVWHPWPREAVAWKAHVTATAVASPPLFPTAGQAQTPAHSRGRQMFLAIPGQRWGGAPNQAAKSAANWSTLRTLHKLRAEHSHQPAALQSQLWGKHPALLRRTDAEMSAWQPGMQNGSEGVCSAAWHASRA